MTSHVIPVALPGPEEQSPAKGAARAGDRPGRAAERHRPARAATCSAPAIIGPAGARPGRDAGPEPRRGACRAARPRRRFLLAARRYRCVDPPVTRAVACAACRTAGRQSGQRQGRAGQERARQKFRRKRRRKEAAPSPDRQDQTARGEDPGRRPSRHRRSGPPPRRAHRSTARRRGRPCRSVRATTDTKRLKRMLLKPGGGRLFRRRVVKRRALVDDVHGQELQRLVADDLESGMRDVAQVDVAGAGGERICLPSGISTVLPSST